MAQHKRRKSGNKKTYKVLVIVCEGEKTERLYFNNYKERDSNLIIKIPYCSDTDPVNLVKYAITQIDRYDLDFRNGDKLWCVFDVDQNPNRNIIRALKIGGKKVEVALSNPCFELWYLLHFINQTNSISCSDVQKLLKKHIKDYEKSKDVFEDLIDNRNIAIKNARNLNQIHVDNSVELLSCESNPSTQVYKIVEFMLSIIR